jgi:hypothetical protein
MSDRIFGFSWDDTHLICALAAGAVALAENEGPSPGEQEIKAAIARVCPHVDEKMQAQVLAHALTIVREQECEAKEQRESPLETSALLARWAQTEPLVLKFSDGTCWEDRAWVWRELNGWSDKWGPRPNQPGCLCPTKYLVEA